MTAFLTALCAERINGITESATETIILMARTQQTFENRQDIPIYIWIEPWPENFELEPGDKLTLIWDAEESGDTVQVDFLNENELVVWPNGNVDDLQFLFNGGSTEGRSWRFKRR